MGPTMILSLIMLLCSSFLQGATAGVLFSTLQRTLVVASAIASHNSTLTDVAKAGEDQLVVTWSLNESLSDGAALDSNYRSVKVKLCFAPMSQVERAWRKTNDDLSKDKTCQFEIAKKPYSRANNTVTWTVEKDVPGATYFVRAYVLDASGTQVGYGQSSNKNKTTNLFVVDPISGRHVSLDIATAVFSAFSIVSLFGFFAVEKWRAKSAQKK